MRRTLCVLLALPLLLGLLTGCSKVDMSWFTSKFTRDSSDTSSETTAQDEAPKQETTAIVTEVLSELESFGLAYQPDYGLHPYN